ncbi:hypothetical protein [Thermoactinomyces mirandus]|uniref:Uncharacterized protein n=1 Tax=Thermoactinomyces mirandus TaxID=2756294 RepID=A0A7W1XRC9_9BACL|nr:hypothetical protein [Thermoactinomyces mirandus]MBA4601725.1 hypothetical protein [Thermoactinomyces mirandus]
MINRTDVKKAIYAYENSIIPNIKKVFSFHFPAETDTILFEVHSGGYGLYGISMTPMSDGEEINYSRIQTLLDEVQTRIKLDQFIDPNDDYINRIDRLDHIMFELIIPFFSECFDKATNRPSHIQYFIRTHEANDVFNLQNKTWVEIEDLYE